MRIFLLAALMLQGLAGLSLAQQQNPDELRFEEWSRFAVQAESTIDAAVASDSELLALRTELQEWRDHASALQKPFKERVDQLEARLGALGAQQDIEQTVSADLEARRAALTENLANAREPLRLAEEIVRWSTGLISGIDTILRERRGARILSAGPSPLLPSSWPGAIEHLSGYSVSLSGEIRQAVSGEAEIAPIRERLPAIAVLFVLGLLLLTTARTQVLKGTARVWKHLGRAGAAGASGIDRFLDKFMLPAIGVQLLAGAINSTGAFVVHSELFTETIPLIGASVLGANWLAYALFTGERDSIFPERLGPASSASLRRLIRSVGWVFAALALADEILMGTDSLGSVSAVVTFPVYVAGSVLLFVLGRRLSRFAASRAPDSHDYGIANSALSVLSIGCWIAAVAGLLASAAGLSVGARLLVFSPMLTLGLFGALLVLQSVVSDLASWVAHWVIGESAERRKGLVFVLLGLLLFAGAVPVVAVIWGATDTELADMRELLLNGVRFGDTQFTVYSLLTMIAVFAAGYLGTRLFQSILSSSILPNTDLSSGAQQAITTGTGYVGIVLSIVIAVSLAGLNLTNIAIVAGALSVGIGFGLQAVVSNFVSGIILLIERPVTVGDWVEAGGVSGTVRRISVRSTLIETFDRAAVVVPNTDLMSSQVVNWTLTDRICRTIVPVGVAYGTDPEKVKRLLLEIAAEHPSVLKDPPPNVLFMRFGADALEFELRAILDDTNMILQAKSDLNFAIAERFAKEGISIPFPQRDVWIRNAGTEALTAAVEPQALPGKEAD